MRSSRAVAVAAPVAAVPAVEHAPAVPVSAAVRLAPVAPVREELRHVLAVPVPVAAGQPLDAAQQELLAQLTGQKAA